MSSQLSHNSAALLPGMIVRFPTDVDREDEDFRDFRIGRIERVEPGASTVFLNSLIYDISVATNTVVATKHDFERPLHQVTRCRILPDSPFTLISTTRSGRVLMCCDDIWPEGAYLEYYVQIDGEVRRLSEADICVSSTRQDSDPVEQALYYELQNPAWRQPRDAVVEGYSDLRSATFGVDDLVGSRVFLLAHQAEVIVRVLSSPECRFMLADEVGLGKTIEACVILKALRRRYAGFKTLIVAPASLTYQWRNELSAKFWLDFPVVQPGQQPNLPCYGSGLIISGEDLAASWAWMQHQRWDLLIVDEAHHLQKNPALYEQVRWLSANIERVLVLTATPIQRRAAEYLSLLKILDPRRYGDEIEHSFERILNAQATVRKTIALVRSQLDPRAFDREEFSEDIEPLGDELSDDTALSEMLVILSRQDEDPDEAIETARQIVAYVSENYRIESRAIRNRRASLEIDLPRRTLDTGYSYDPSEAEGRLLEDLYDYAHSYVAAVDGAPLALEYARALLHAAASSPQALHCMLRWREGALRQGVAPLVDERARLVPAAPRQEQSRLRQLAAASPAAPDERDLVARLIRQAEYWQEQSEAALSALRRASMEQPSRHRLAQCLRAAYAAVEGRRATKMVIFSGWTQTVEVLIPHLARLLGRDAVARFTADMSDEALQDAADRFQSSDECYVLVCDELGGEGRNFQIADGIVHVDIPWTPAQVEQRIGRVDRLGRTGEVRSMPLFARETLEHDLFRIWDDALQLFTRSMSGMEIALESTQDELMKALGRSVREGVSGLLDPMRRQAEDLREAVEQERYFEDAAINKDLREEFEKISRKYRDGAVIRSAVHGWTSMAGLSNYQIKGDQMIYNARHFSLAAMRNARFLPPNMEEAARRSGRQRTAQIVGTFNRDLAVRREDLVFFAPGDDPWTDAVITNALECDRGRCCAVGFPPEPGLTEPFFELLYSFQIDPRPLYEAGLDPIYMLQAQNFLAIPHKRLLIAAADGKVLRRPDVRFKLTGESFKDKKTVLVHLGQRKHGANQSSELDRLRERYPADVWNDLVRSGIAAAERFLDSDIGDFAAELADKAAQEFRRRTLGWEASLRWQASHGAQYVGEDTSLTEYRRAAEALVIGIRHPIRRLESICFWEPIGGER